MGYEVIYKYHERNSEGSGYDASEVQEIKRAVGGVYEDLPPEKLVSAIVTQMARRDIWVVDVEVYEFVRKKLAFRETKGGIVIGNRKYSFDQCDGTVSYTAEVEIPPPSPPPPPPPPRELPLAGRPRPDQTARNLDMNISQEDMSAGENLGDALYFKNKNPLRQEVFAPKDPALAKMARQKKLPFSFGSTYSIYYEKLAPGGVLAGMLYTVRDDNGQRQVLSDKFFDIKPNLFAGELFNDDNPLVEGGEAMEMDMPQLRSSR